MDISSRVRTFKHVQTNTGARLQRRANGAHGTCEMQCIFSGVQHSTLAHQVEMLQMYRISVLMATINTPYAGRL
jgi:hypothetical protein